MKEYRGFKRATLALASVAALLGATAASAQAPGGGATAASGAES